MDTFRQRRRGEGLLADGDDAARRRARSAIAKLVNAAIRGRRAALGAPRCGSSTRSRSSRRATRYRDSIEVDGEDTIVRESDGIHLNDAGAAIAADAVLERIDQDFTR